MLEKQVRLYRPENPPVSELKKLGDVLWRGPALEVAESAVLPKRFDVGSYDTPVSFWLKAENLPLNGNISPEELVHLRAHIRSRYAHEAVDLHYHTGLQLADAITQHGFPQSGEKIKIDLLMRNHCARPIELPQGAKPFHLYYAPESAYVHGEELESIIGSEEGRHVRIRGEEGEDWRIHQLYKNGKDISGVLLKIDKSNRVWIPESDEPLRMPETGSFQYARELLFQYVYKDINDSEFPMPPGGLWIGRAPYVELDNSVYLELSHDAFIERDGLLIPVAFQTHSPLLEGQRTKHHPHVELIGNADWVFARVIRNQEEAQQG